MRELGGAGGLLGTQKKNQWLKKAYFIFKLFLKFFKNMFMQILSFTGTDILIGDPLGNLAITPQVCER